MIRKFNQLIKETEKSRSYLLTFTGESINIIYQSNSLKVFLNLSFLASMLNYFDPLCGQEMSCLPSHMKFPVTRNNYRSHYKSYHI